MDSYSGNTAIVIIKLNFFLLKMFPLHALIKVLHLHGEKVKTKNFVLGLYPNFIYPTMPTIFISKGSLNFHTFLYQWFLDQTKLKCPEFLVL